MIHEKHYHETVISVAVSPDDAYFAAGGGGKLAVVWRVDNGEQVACFETSDTITSVAFFSASDEHERSSGGGADVRPEGLGIGGTNDTLLVCGTFDKRIYGFSLNAALMGETAAVQLFCHTFPGQVNSLCAAQASSLLGVGGTDRTVHLYQLYRCPTRISGRSMATVNPFPPCGPNPLPSSSTDTCAAVDDYAKHSHPSQTRPYDFSGRGRLLIGGCGPRISEGDGSPSGIAAADSSKDSDVVASGASRGEPEGPIGSDKAPFCGGGFHDEYWKLHSGSSIRLRPPPDTSRAVAPNAQEHSPPGGAALSLAASISTPGDVLAVALNSEGSVLAVGGEWNCAEVHAVSKVSADGRLATFRLRTIDVGGGVHSLAFAPIDDEDFGFVDYTRGTRLRMTGTVSRRWSHTGEALSSRHSQQRLRLAIGSSDETHVWRIQIDSRLRSHLEALLVAPAPPVGATSKAIPAEELHVAAYVEPLLMTPHPARQGGVAFSGCGDILAVAGDHSVTLLDSGTGATLRQERHRRRLRCVALSSDGGLLLVGGFDQLVKMYPVYAGTDFIRYEGLSAELALASPPLGISKQSPSPAISDDSLTNVSCGMGNLGRLGLGGLRALPATAAGSSYHATVIALSECDSLVLLAGGLKGGVGYVQIYDARADRLLCTLLADREIRCAAFSADGHYIALGGFGEAVHVLRSLPVRQPSGVVELIPLPTLADLMAATASVGATPQASPSSARTSDLNSLATTQGSVVTSLPARHSRGSSSFRGLALYRAYAHNPGVGASLDRASRAPRDGASNRDSDGGIDSDLSPVCPSAAMMSMGVGCTSSACAASSRGSYPGSGVPQRRIPGGARRPQAIYEPNDDPSAPVVHVRQICDQVLPFRTPGRPAFLWSCAFSGEGSRREETSRGNRSEHNNKFEASANAAATVAGGHREGGHPGSSSGSTSFFAVASWNGEARIYRISNDGRFILHCIIPRADRVYSVSLSYDGRLVAVGGRDSAIGLYDVEATAALQQQALSTASRNQLSPDAAEPDMSTASTLERGSEACLSGGTAPSPSGVQQSDDEEKAANTVTSSHGTQRHHDDSLTEADGSGQAHAETVEFWLFTMNEYVYACKLSQEPEGPRFCIHGGPDKVLTIRDAGSGQVLHAIDTGGTIWSLSIGAGNRCAVSGESHLVQVYDLETAASVLVLPHQGDNPSLSVALTHSAVCFTQENACLRYGKDESTYGWGDLPSYAALAKLLKAPSRQSPNAGWAALRSLVKLQPALINCREQQSGSTFLQLAISHGVDGDMLDALLGEGHTIGLLRAHHPGLVPGGYASAWHAALAKESSTWIARLVQCLIDGRIHTSPAAMSPVRETFEILARTFPREYLRLLGEMPLAIEEACTLSQPHSLRSSIEVCGSRYHLLEGYWEAHVAAHRARLLQLGTMSSWGAWIGRWEARAAGRRTTAAEIFGTSERLSSDGRYRRGGPVGDDEWSLEGALCWWWLVGPGSILRWGGACCMGMVRCLGRSCYRKHLDSARRTYRADGVTARDSSRYDPTADEDDDEMEGGGNIPAHERALGIFRSVTRLRAAMSTTAEPAPTLWQRLQDERPGPATLRAGSATIGGAGSHRASAVASPVLSHAHCSTASAPRARMSNASAAGGNNTTSVNAMGGGGRPVKQAGGQHGRQSSGIPQGEGHVKVIPFEDFAGYSTNHLALIVDAAVSTNDRSAFRSSAVEALLVFKWQAFGSSIWTLHVGTWLAYTLVSAMFAYASVYYFSDSDSHWKAAPIWSSNGTDTLDCASRSGFPFMPVPPSGVRDAEYCSVYLFLLQTTYIASSVLGVTYLGINAILFWHNSHQSRSHFSFQLATAHTLWRLLIGITQLSGVVLVHLGSSYEGGLLGCGLTRLLLASGILMQWVEMVRILTRHSAFGELYQMVLEALHTSRAFLAFLLLICLGGTLPLGLLLFDVHTQIHPGDGYPHERSSAMLLLQEEYQSTATGTIDLWYNFGDIFRAFHTALDIFLFGSKGDAVESALLEVWPARYIAVVLQVLVQIVLLNLLIAKLSDAYAKIKASSLLASNFQQAILLIEYEILARVIFSPRSGRWPRWLHVCLPPEPPAQRDRISDLQDDLALLRRELAEMRQRQLDVLDGRSSIPPRLEATLEAIVAGQLAHERALASIQASLSIGRAGVASTTPPAAGFSFGAGRRQGSDRSLLPRR